MAVKTLEELFVHQLSDIYSAEKQLTKALPRLARAAAAEELSAAFEAHLEETRGRSSASTRWSSCWASASSGSSARRWKAWSRKARR